MGPQMSLQVEKWLTLTRVVFKYDLYNTEENVEDRLTLTRVVFKYVTLHFTNTKKERLTLTRVVFKFGWLINNFFILFMINLNKSCI